MRLQTSSADAVNAYLDTDAGWKQDGLPFFTEVKQCKQAALKLMLVLAESTNASAVQGNNDLLELAMGRCPEILLPMVPIKAVPRLCSVDAWAESRKRPASAAEQISEINRRLVVLERTKLATSSEIAKSCLGAYIAKRTALSLAQ